MSGRPWGVLFFAAIVTMPSAASAGAFELRQQSAAGEGSSFAGVGAGGSLSSMFWNPATLSDVQGLEVEANAMGVFPIADVTVDPGLGFPGADEGDIAPDAFVPASYGAYRLTDRLVFGVAITSPFGLQTRYDSDSILAMNGVAGVSKLFTFNVNPAVSYQVTDWLSVGVGLQAEYLNARLSRLGLGALGLSSAEGDDIAFGFTAGFKLRPAPGTEIGVGYRSFIEHELDGKLKTTNAGAFDVNYDNVDMPDILTFGIRQQLTDRFRLMAGGEWINWSRFDSVAVDGGPAPIALAFHYDDGWFFSLGGEYQVSDSVTLRSGVGYEIAPIDDDVRSFRLPDNDGLWLSAGLSYRFDERLSLDLGYSLLLINSTRILAAGAGGPAGNGPFSGAVDTQVHFVAAAVTMRFD